MAAAEPIEIPVKLVFGVPEATEVRRLVLRPGDKLVMRFDRHLHDDEAADIIDRLHATLGDDLPVLILGPGCDLEVISPEAGG